jgi:hypothetical protein
MNHTDTFKEMAQVEIIGERLQVDHRLRARCCPPAMAHTVEPFITSNQSEKGVLQQQQGVDGFNVSDSLGRD